MSSGSQEHDGEQHDKLKGWDTGAFWFPTLDKRGAFLAIFLVLLVLHFDELFGIAGNTALIAGWLPQTYAYHILMNLVHIAFMILLYLNWPYPNDEVIEESDLLGEATTSTEGTPADPSVPEGE